MSKFGWSYPAGAENDPFAPYNYDEPPDWDGSLPVPPGGTLEPEQITIDDFTRVVVERDELRAVLDYREPEVQP